MKHTFCLCDGRHTIPGDPPALFPNSVDPTDTVGLFDAADAAIPADCTDLDVYVTGLTPATLAVVDVCNQRGISMTALHFNRDTGGYFRQQVLAFRDCPLCGRRQPANTGWVCPWCGG